MKTILTVLTLALVVAGCSGGVTPADDLGDADGGTEVDASYTCPPTYEECAAMVLCTVVCSYDDAGMPVLDAGLDADAPGDAGDDLGADADAGLDAGSTVCSSLADGCTGSFPFPGVSDDTVMTSPGPFFGSVGDFRESAPQVLPAVLVARHLDLTNVYVSVAGGAAPCGPPPSFRVLVNHVEVGRFTPSGFRVEDHVGFDFPDITGTVFTVRIEETTAWCDHTLYVTHGGLAAPVATLSAP